MIFALSRVYSAEMTFIFRSRLRDLPGWIEKGKKMPGHMGDVNRTIPNLEVVQIRPEDNAILVKGSVPGARNGTLFVRKSLKNNVIAAKAKKGA